jgi:hypothetical protein
MIPALALVLCLLPMFAAAAEVRTEAVHTMTIPGSWNPLWEQTPESTLLLSLTADRLYHVSADGSELIPSLAAGLPADVTAEYAGTYGVPVGAKRGYAFAIELNPEARWEDGTPLTAADWLFTLQLMLEKGLDVPEPANLRAFRDGQEKPTEDVISLMEAGFSSVEEARDAGHTMFYVNTGDFWGLGCGWQPITDGTPLLDAAIPSGITERYVCGAYLYDRYLRTGAEQSMFQSEFVGVSARPEYVSQADVGLLESSEYRFLLILDKPTTADALALKLGAVTVLPADRYGDNYATSAATYAATGPYRIVSAAGGEMVLEPNPCWLGLVTAPRADVILLGADIGT